MNARIVAELSNGRSVEFVVDMTEDVETPMAVLVCTCGAGFAIQDLQGVEGETLKNMFDRYHPTSEARKNALVDFMTSHTSPDAHQACQGVAVSSLEDITPYYGTA